MASAVFLAAAIARIAWLAPDAVGRGIGHVQPASVSWGSGIQQKFPRLAVVPRVILMHERR